MELTRDQLLQNLRVVQQKLTEMMNVYSDYVQLEQQFRTPKASIDSIGRSNRKWSFVGLQASCAIYTLVLFLIHPSAAGGVFLAFMIAAPLLVLRSTEKKENINAGTIPLGIIAFISAFSCAGSLNKSSANITVMAVSVLLALAGVRRIVVRKNESIVQRNEDIARYNRGVDEDNQALQAQRLSIYNQYEALREDLLRFGDGWYPPNYYNVEAVNFFVEVIGNFRANTVQEMINLLEQTEQQNKMLAYQKSIQNQLRVANLVNAASLFELKNIGNTVSNIDNTVSSAYGRAQIQANYDRFN